MLPWLSPQQIMRCMCCVLCVHLFCAVRRPHACTCGHAACTDTDHAWSASKHSPNHAAHVQLSDFAMSLCALQICSGSLKSEEAAFIRLHRSACGLLTPIKTPRNVTGLRPDTSAAAGADLAHLSGLNYYCCRNAGNPACKIVGMGYAPVWLHWTRATEQGRLQGASDEASEALHSSLQPPHRVSTVLVSRVGAL
eukprot:365273-Chlamydomonas_euryale.AAC.4